MNELQVSAESDDVITALRKAKRVASKLNRHDIAAWLDSEQNGYKNNDDLPDYRRIMSEFAYDTNGYIPVGFNMVKSGVMRLGNMGMNLRIPLPDPIGAVLDLIEKTTRGNGLYYPCSSDISRVIKSTLNHSFPHVVDQIVIMHQMDIPSVKDIPNQVKNRILDWALEVERAGIHGEGHTFTPVEQQHAEQVTFNDYSTKIHTGSFQGAVQIGSPHATQNANISISEATQAIQGIEDAVKASDEIDDVDQRDIKASLDLIRDLAGKDATPKSKQKITEKLAAVVATVESCEKLAPVVKPLIMYLKSKLGLA